MLVQPEQRQRPVRIVCYLAFIFSNALKLISALFKQPFFRHVEDSSYIPTGHHESDHFHIPDKQI